MSADADLTPIRQRALIPAGKARRRSSSPTETARRRAWAARVNAAQRAERIRQGLER